MVSKAFAAEAFLSDLGVEVSSSARPEWKVPCFDAVEKAGKLVVGCDRKFDPNGSGAVLHKCAPPKGSKLGPVVPKMWTAYQATKSTKDAATVAKHEAIKAKATELVTSRS